MKKGIVGFSLFAIALMLGGCSSEPVTKTCTSDADGIYDEMVITSVDGKVTKLEERLELDFSDYGATEEDMSDLTDEDLKDLYESSMPELADEMDGITIDYQLDGTKGNILISIDFEKADPSVLADLGVIDTDTSNISLDLSIEELEQQGYTCK